MTAKELYTSLIFLYKNLMFPKDEKTRAWSMEEIDRMDLHFFDELMQHNEEGKEAPEEDVYLSDVW